MCNINHSDYTNQWAFANANIFLIEAYNAILFCLWQDKTASWHLQNIRQCWHPSVQVALQKHPLMIPVLNHSIKTNTGLICWESLHHIHSERPDLVEECTVLHVQIHRDSCVTHLASFFLKYLALAKSVFSSKVLLWATRRSTKACGEKEHTKRRAF